MENNGNEEEKNLQNTVQTAEEVGHLVKDTVNVVKDVGSQNWAGVVKDAYNILTNKAIWKSLKIIIIPIVAILLIPAVIGAMVFGVLSAVKDVVIDLVNTISNFISNIIQWISNDYWIDINEVKEYTNSSGVTKTGTTVDQYIDELDKLGISLKSLRLLGDSEEDYQKALEDPETEKIVKKYISEFVRADIITQNFHRRHGDTAEELVSSSTETPDAENLVDGGIYIKSNTINDVVANDSTFLGMDGETVNDVVGVNFSKDIKFVDYADLLEDVNEINQNSNRYPDTSKLKQFSINNEGYISVIKLEVTTNEGETGVAYNAKAEIVNYDYKTIIAKYSMPFEFLINLCEVTQNPEFVYHVARLARSTNIQLVIPYNTYYEQEKIIKEGEYTEVNGDDVPPGLYSGSYYSSETLSKTEIWQPQMPMLKQADTWSFADINTFKYQEIISTKTEQKPDQESSEQVNWYKDGLEGPVTVIPVKVKYTQTNEKRKYSIEYSQAEGSISVEKSKRFLGLLRNETGTCVCEDCYENWSSAQTCAEDAEFKKSGTNVKYAIPNSGKLEEPLHKLESGIEMLYVLLENSLGTIKEAEIEKQSAYTEKMQGIVTHLRYLMTYPENEQDIDMGNLNDPSMIGASIIVKTDETGAAPAVTVDQLTTIINSKISGSDKKHNALSIVDKLVEYQDEYNVNAVFMLALVNQETSIGTANTSYVRDDNNWTSYNLGHKYSTVDSNIKTTMDKIANGSYYFKDGKYTIAEIGLTYCPNTEELPTQGTNWVNQVTSMVISYYDCIGITIEPEDDDNSDNSAKFGTYTSSSNGKTYICYKQRAYPNIKYEDGTVASQGCNVTSACIILSGYGKKDVDPDKLLNGGTSYLINIYEYMRKYGVVAQYDSISAEVSQSKQEEFENVAKANVKSKLQSGGSAIITVRTKYGSKIPAGSVHWITLVDIKTINGVTQVYVIDPGGKDNKWYCLDDVINGVTGYGLI